MVVYRLLEVRTGYVTQEKWLGQVYVVLKRAYTVWLIAILYWLQAWLGGLYFQVVNIGLLRSTTAHRYHFDISFDLIINGFKGLRAH